MSEPFVFRCIGASVRSLMASARRAGWSPAGVDLFADADTHQLGPVCRCDPERYPLSLLEHLDFAANSPWMFTGGLENAPAVLTSLAASGTLLGGPLEAIAKLRDPAWIVAQLQAAELDALPIRFSPPVWNPHERWLEKPIASAGGNRIHVFSPYTSNRPIARAHANTYWQQFQGGIVGSGLFLVGAESAQFLGFTRIRTQLDANGEDTFRYAGNLGPITLPSSLNRRFEQIGDALLLTAGIRGLVGIDVVLTSMSDSGRILPLEVNPRYTASVELYEYAWGVSLLAAHRIACETGQLVPIPVPNQAPICGKAIVYAPRPYTIPEDAPWNRSLHSGSDFPDYADIPHAGDAIEAGQPVLTVFAKATNAFHCAEFLSQNEQSVLDWLNAYAMEGVQ
ncbi:ATP-grasp domain-containing protein [Tuwongella immobilis]|uniref:ATP-grasp fold PylC-type domain-containing protein n=1 Tax=Tuwongella immobilis TaxID=692036 RepID=A0A6C2YPV0_9BACT|nr:ATP-grasp domain-containing protein [Tuwongella immobilis]VIP03377.1 atp-dependent carboligase : Uncharacterized protein OS=Pirellula staleyi (strain ATCC 27377 / DSM 6068 / ICPB 4128) GN=Psta_2471 PE=4 SV=1: ATP-grasp_3 [Tuwongella immobilis]VTS04126.1 atp-dependent carboligase : Uncharacterized protein OS=Pirellula staleyi (strain ATCC 27377 / DSM 6068 / ICPB 4128) GN=Psta_2471 PE=4 SV=1: ATP-grasp_3 [Tuwongella immobilis]